MPQRWSGAPPLFLPPMPSLRLADCGRTRFAAHTTASLRRRERSRVQPFPARRSIPWQKRSRVPAGLPAPGSVAVASRPTRADPCSMRKTSRAPKPTSRLSGWAASIAFSTPSNLNRRDYHSNCGQSNPGQVGGHPLTVLDHAPRRQPGHRRYHRRDRGDGLGPDHVKHAGLLLRFHFDVVGDQEFFQMIAGCRPQMRDLLPGTRRFRRPTRRDPQRCARGRSGLAHR